MCWFSNGAQATGENWRDSVSSRQHQWRSTARYFGGTPGFVIYLGDFSSPSPLNILSMYRRHHFMLFLQRPSLYRIMQFAATCAARWAAAHDMLINALKAKKLVFSLPRKVVNPPLTTGDSALKQVTSSKLLGVTLTSNQGISNSFLPPYLGPPTWKQ